MVKCVNRGNSDLCKHLKVPQYVCRDSESPRRGELVHTLVDQCALLEIPGKTEGSTLEQIRVQFTERINPGGTVI